MARQKNSQLLVTTNHKENVSINLARNSETMGKMMEMLQRYKERASEADNSIVAIKKQFEKQIQAIQAENRELKPLMKKLEGNIKEEVEDERKA